MIKQGQILLLIVLIGYTTSLPISEFAQCQEYIEIYAQKSCENGSKCQQEVTEQCRDKRQSNKDCQFFDELFPRDDDDIDGDANADAGNQVFTPQAQKDFFNSRFVTKNDSDKKEIDDYLNEYETLYQIWYIDQSNQKNQDALMQHLEKFDGIFQSMYQRLEVNEDLRKASQSCEQQCLGNLTNSVAKQGFTFFVDCLKGDIEASVVKATIKKLEEQTNSVGNLMFCGYVLIATIILSI